MAKKKNGPTETEAGSGSASWYALLPKEEQRTEARGLTRLLVYQGHKVPALADLCKVTPGSVYRWYRASSAPTPAQYALLQEIQAQPVPEAPRPAPLPASAPEELPGRLTLPISLLLNHAKGLDEAAAQALRELQKLHPNAQIELVAVTIPLR